MTISKERKAMLHAARQAGKIILKYFGKKSQFEEKSNKSLVSRADLEANKAIIKAIKENFPKHSILSEETGFENNDSDYKWVIDPIDGTHNFLRGIPIFGISIALEYKNEVVLGVLEFPTLKITATAEKGKGAFLNGKRLKVSSNKDITHAFILYEFVPGTRHKALEFLKRLSNETINIRNLGCAVYELLLIASGQCDAFAIFTTHEWDIAAGLLLVAEAGGRMTDIHGNECGPSNGNFIFSNSAIHNEILRFVHDI